MKFEFLMMKKKTGVLQIISLKDKNTLKEEASYLYYRSIKTIIFLLRQQNPITSINIF